MWRSSSCVDSPTISNAIEPFKVRDRTEGFIGGEVRSLFPEMPPMVGAALTVTMNNTPGAVAGRENYWRMYEALRRCRRRRCWWSRTSVERHRDARWPVR